MVITNKEYFIKPYYFYLAEKPNKVSLYYSVGNTLNETKNNDDVIDFDKDDLDKVRKSVSQILKTKKLKTKDQIKKYFQPLTKKKSEIEELIDLDGTMRNSKIPILDLGMHPRKTTDQTVIAARMTNNPVTRGYRKYYGENTDADFANLKEIDFSDAFGYEETKDMDGKKTYKYLKNNMGMTSDEAKDRTKQFGKDPSGKRKEKVPSKIKSKPGFIDRMTISELEKSKMMKMVEDILLNKRGSDAEIGEKEEKISNILKKNISVLKKMAEKEGITLSKLIKFLRSE